MSCGPMTRTFRKSFISIAQGLGEKGGLKKKFFENKFFFLSFFLLSLQFSIAHDAATLSPERGGPT
jgi:hypothetical protein